MAEYFLKNTRQKSFNAIIKKLNTFKCPNITLWFASPDLTEKQTDLDPQWIKCKRNFKDFYPIVSKDSNQHTKLPSKAEK